MTGSGTIDDPFVIYDVDDLQAMQDDLTAYYELANDIDASATSAWNDGDGFQPIAYRVFQRIPTGDLFSAGTWTLFPLGGTMTSKLQPIPASYGGGGLEDDDYIQTTEDNSEAVFSFSALPSLPSWVTGISYIYIMATIKEVVSGDGEWDGVLRIGGVNYYGDYTKHADADWQTDSAIFTKNPFTGLSWQIADLATIQGFGIRVGVALPAGTRISEMCMHIVTSPPTYFEGQLNGRNHTISGLTIRRYHLDYQALISQTYSPCIIQNVHLKDVSIKGSYYIGGLVAYCWTSSILDCSVTGDLEAIYDGGLLAGVFRSWAAEPGDIKRCYSSGTITAVRAWGNGIWGGLVGYLRGTIPGTVIENCFSIIQINPSTWGLTKTVEAGGLFGEVYGGTICQCYAGGDVNISDYAGGLAAAISATVENCYSRVNVASEDLTTEAGGFVAWLSAPSSITNCYATGRVVAKPGRESGFEDWSDGEPIIACFWDTETSETDYTQGGGAGPTKALGKTTAQMKTESTFTDAGWDFTTIWGLFACNDGYPCLRGVTPSCTVAPVVAPNATTDAATDVGSGVGTVNGTLDDDGGEACDCGFEWGETVAYGNITPTQSRETGQTFSQELSGLDPDTTYHFRAFATNSAGTGYGADMTFTTSAPSPIIVIPTVTSDEPTIAEEVATIIGTLVNNGGEDCYCYFEWGRTVAYGNIIEIGTKTTSDTFSQKISGLTPNTEYHFRAYARNSAGTGYGIDREFTTQQRPLVNFRPIENRSYVLSRWEL